MRLKLIASGPEICCKISLQAGLVYENFSRIMIFLFYFLFFIFCLIALPASTSAIYSSQRSMSKNNLCVSAPMAYTGRRGSDVGPGGADNTSSIMWIFFVLKQWVTKHFFVSSFLGGVNITIPECSLCEMCCSLQCIVLLFPFEAGGGSRWL